MRNSAVTHSVTVCTSCRCSDNRSGLLRRLAAVCLCGFTSRCGWGLNENLRLQLGAFIAGFHRFINTCGHMLYMKQRRCSWNIYRFREKGWKKWRRDSSWRRTLHLHRRNEQVNGEYWHQTIMRPVQDLLKIHRMEDGKRRMKEISELRLSNPSAGVK